MPRNSHTSTRFRGVDYTSSVANIPPDSAIDSLNCYGDMGGFLVQFQQPSILLDWSNPANASTNIAPTLSIGSLLTPNAYPRLLIQQGAQLLYSDYPYSSAAFFLHNVLSGLTARLDYALCNGILFFSNGQDGGYAVPGVGTRYLWGILPPPSPILISASTSWVPGSITVQRTAGVTTITFSNPHGAAVGDPCYIDSDPSAPWDSTFFGVFRIASVPTSSSLTFLQSGPDSGPFTRATYPFVVTVTTGWQYGACYGGSLVEHFSSLSPISANTGAFTNQSPTVLVPPTTDWQVDQVAFFRNQDGVVVGGGLWYLEDTLPLISSGYYKGYTVFCDTQTDEQLATSGQTAPYDNGVSPNGKYLAVWLDRIMMCGITDDETGVRYTGFETILFGRPQMSWCTYNEIKLGQGQAKPLGMGLLRYGGMIFFADNGFMYIYRGTLSDVSVSAPTSLSFYAEQLPYSIGIYSHYTIQSTPAGCVWLDDGFNLRVMDNTGFYPPKLLAPQLSGLFSRITPGSQDVVTSVHFTYLQHDWYILAFPIDGSLINNMCVVVDVTADPAKNMGAFPVSHSVSDFIWAAYPDQSLHLLASQPQLTSPADPPTAGYITEIPILQPLIQGVADPTAPTPNPPMPGAYWRGGYFGIHDEQGEDEFSFIKMFRYLRLNGSLASGLKVQAYLVNGEEWTWDNPAPYDFDMDGDVGGLNVKARCLSPLILFPNDALATVVSLMLAWVVTAER